MNTVTAGQSLFHQTHTVVFYSAAVICLVLTQLPLVVKRGESFARRCYWGGTAGAAVFTVLGSLPQLGGGALLALAGVFSMTLTAYFATSYIKIGDKVYAFHTDDEEPGRQSRPATAVAGPPDSYGTDVTNAKMWWLLVPATAMCAATVAMQLPDHRLALTVVAAVMVVFLGCGFGFMDAREGHLVARGQYVQFGLVTVVTVGAFALCYLPAYAVTRGLRA